MNVLQGRYCVLQVCCLSFSSSLPNVRKWRSEPIKHVCPQRVGSPSICFSLLIQVFELWDEKMRKRKVNWFDISHHGRKHTAVLGQKKSNWGHRRCIKRFNACSTCSSREMSRVLYLYFIISVFWVISLKSWSLWGFKDTCCNSAFV